MRIFATKSMLPARYDRNNEKNASFFTWLISFARNVALQQRKRDAQHAVRSEAVSDDEAWGVEDQLGDKAQKSSLAGKPPTPYDALASAAFCELADRAEKMLPECVDCLNPPEKKLVWLARQNPFLRDEEIKAILGIDDAEFHRRIEAGVVAKEKRNQKRNAKGAGNQLALNERLAALVQKSLAGVTLLHGNAENDLANFLFQRLRTEPGRNGEKFVGLAWPIECRSRVHRGTVAQMNIYLTVEPGYTWVATTTRRWAETTRVQRGLVVALRAGDLPAGDHICYLELKFCEEKHPSLVVQETSVRVEMHIPRAGEVLQ